MSEEVPVGLQGPQTTGPMQMRSRRLLPSNTESQCPCPLAVPQQFDLFDRNGERDAALDALSPLMPHKRWREIATPKKNTEQLLTYEYFRTIIRRTSYFLLRPVLLLMSDSSAPIPTDAELSLLRVLWAEGPSTVREVHGHLDETGYTTVLKQLQIMRDKGLVTRDESSRAHVYTSAVQQEETEGKLIDDLLDRAFGGSARRLVMRALSGNRVSHGEIGAIRELLDSINEDTFSDDGVDADD